MAPTPTPTPVPRGSERTPSRPYLTRDPPDIENLESVLFDLNLEISKFKFETFIAGAQPSDKGVRERGAVDGDEEEQEALEEERRQREEPQ